MHRDHHRHRNLLAWLAVPVLLSSPAIRAAEPGVAETYKCASGNLIVVQVEETTPGSPTAKLDYLGQTFEMRQVSPGRFSTEQGLQPDHGLQWFTDGTEATLQEMLMDHTAPEPAPIETCTRDTGSTADAAATPAAQDLPIGSWQLATIAGAPAAEGVETRITFNEDASINGNGGCNTFGGGVVMAGTGITLPNVFSTMMMCEGPKSAQENAFFGVLENTVSHRVESDQLLLLGKDGETLATLAPVAGTEASP